MFREFSKFAIGGLSALGFQAKKHFGLFVLDYMVTSNHIHFLVKDTATNVIAQSMQVIAGRTAQEYNQRKNRQGAFWEDRYHATAIEADEHVHRCLVYILARWKPRGRTAASP
jgi:REP element-mobilizing transposase RayT